MMSSSEFVARMNGRVASCKHCHKKILNRNNSWYHVTMFGGNLVEWGKVKAAKPRKRLSKEFLEVCRFCDEDIMACYPRVIMVFFYGWRHVKSLELTCDSHRAAP